MSTQYSEKIDYLKGFAIILVVAGHYKPQHYSGTWEILVSGIYMFHMPLFMMVSGYLYEKKSGKYAVDYKSFISKKSRRLLIPYFVISVVILIVKGAAQSMKMHLEFPVTGDVIYRIFVNPNGGYAEFLWFIYVLFLIFLIYPILTKFIINRLILTIVLLLSSFILLPDAFCLNRLFKYMIYFHCGVLLSSMKDKQMQVSKLKTVLCAGVFMLLFIYRQSALANHRYSIGPVIDLLAAISGSAILWLIAWTMKNRRVAGVFQFIGIYSAAIYLLHTSMMGPFKVAAWYLARSNDVLQAFWGLLTILSGIFMPILITCFVLNRSRFLSLAILGVPETKKRALLDYRIFQFKNSNVTEP